MWKNIIKRWVIIISLTALEIYAFTTAPRLEEKVGGIIVIALTWGFFVLYLGMKSKCPHCKTLFALRHTTTEAVRCDDISVKVKTDARDFHGNVIGHLEQYVPGTRTTYHENYVCKKCGQNSFKAFTKETANV